MCRQRGKKAEIIFAELLVNVKAVLISAFVDRASCISGAGR